MKSRTIELLREASKAFEDMRDPFSTEWLCEHDVTADECYDLSMAISSAIDLLLIGMPEGKKK
jgi:hypothetical protein